MKAVRTFTVVPALPEALARLRELAGNLWWCWNHDAISLFRRLDLDLWESCGHNPVQMLGNISQEKLEELQRDEGFLAHYQRVLEDFDDYLAAEKTWFKENYGEEEAPAFAYFSAEYGLNESLPLYSGGLGILAGDFLKSASDMGLPLVAVGLAYQEGYFRQYLSADGWQQESYPDNDFYNLPFHLARDAAGAPLRVAVDIEGRPVDVQIWRVPVGRVPLYLLDTNLPSNRPEERQITAQLYGGDLAMRIKQEIVLGIGGVRALLALGIDPQVCHLNEGHSAFLALERIRCRMQQHQLTFDQARELVAAGNVFTTHTPVPAGNDMFPPELMDRFFAQYYPPLGLSRQQFLALGRQNPNDPNEPFCMTVLALKLAAHANGVSQLHGHVSRQMWQRIWPSVPLPEIPITAITNGVHIRSWISHDMAELYDRYLGPRWVTDPADPQVWARVEQIPDAELWRTHERRRERLVAFARRRLRQQLLRRGAPSSEIAAAAEVLDPDALTLGFARRFATYKRATLIFRDLERLFRLVSDPKRPVQFIFAGKAHPRDNQGKELIKQLVHIARGETWRGRLVFLEDYDICVARYLVQGVDVWLNTPRRPLEASGTSGMKVPPNGGINLSVLDGWWPECYDGENGWAIGAGEDYEDLGYQDEVESRTIYNLLEKEIVPLFYHRGGDGLPRGWIAKMKKSIRSVAPCFNTDRMVAGYTTRFYLPSQRRWRQLVENEQQGAKELAQWKERLRRLWPQIRWEKVVFDGSAIERPVGAELHIQAGVFLGAVAPEEVRVELYHGALNAADEILDGQAEAMHRESSDGKGGHVYVGAIPCSQSGRRGFLVRVLPHHVHLAHRFEPGLILWG